MHISFTLVAFASWAVLLLVWLPGYFSDMQRARRAAPAAPVQVLSTVLIGAALAILLEGDWLGLGLRVTSQARQVRAAGLAVDLVGIGFAVWSKLALGANWAGVVMRVNEGQALVQSGPYAIVRHPIYTGLLLAMLGTAITIGSVGGYVAVAVGLTGLLLRIHIEEPMLAAHFGEAHTQYRLRVKALVPFVW